MTMMTTDIIIHGNGGERQLAKSKGDRGTKKAVHGEEEE
jgi:hypothetical protein